LTRCGCVCWRRRFPGVSMGVGIDPVRMRVRAVVMPSGRDLAPCGLHCGECDGGSYS
jgi:hypothetical protein